MKKTLFIIAACALAAVSCQKESAVENEIKSEGIITVTADIAQFGGDTKTSINGSAENPKPLWSAGDEIKLFDTDGNSAIYVLKSGEEGKSSATFEIKSGETALSGTFACAYYPAANATAYTDGTGITATIPATQAYTAANSGDTGTDAGTFAPGAAPMVGTGTLNAETGNLGLTFRNVFGILQLNFTGSETIKQIDVIGTANLSGTATISLDGDSNPTCSISSGQNYMTLTGVNQTLDASNSKAFYIAVPAGETLISKVGVTTTTAGYNKSMTSAKTITRSSILSLSSMALSSMTSGAIYQEAPDLTPVTVGSCTWAPVNCGYDASHTYGLLYQWGRKYGQGYDGEDPAVVTTEYTSAYSSHVDTDDTNKDKFYYSTSLYNWYGGSDPDKLWDTTGGSQNSHTPVKSSYDPCPAGWRVPTNTELSAIISTKSWITNGGPSSDQYGYLFGTSPNQVFLPAAGYRDFDIGNANYRGDYGSYWSSSVNDNSAKRLSFSGGYAVMYYDYRASGSSVRCVQE